MIRQFGPAWVAAQIKDIFLSPKNYWIKNESAQLSFKEFFVNYTAVVIVFPPLFHFLQLAIFGMPVPFLDVKVHLSLFASLFSAVLDYLLLFVLFYVSPLVLGLLAKALSLKISSDDFIRLISLSATPVLLGSVGLLCPYREWLLLIAIIYSLFLYWVGLRSLSLSLEYTVLFALLSVLVLLVVAAILRTGTAGFQPATQLQ